jgi:uncharacterized membrane protein
LVKINLVGCHRSPKRSFFWKNQQFPVCARCTGIYIGFLTFPFFILGYIHINTLLSIAIIFPTIIDGLTQAYLNRESTNFLRISTGLFAGLGISSLIHLLGEKTGLLILKLLT